MFIYFLSLYVKSQLMFSFSLQSLRHHFY